MTNVRTPGRGVPRDASSLPDLPLPSDPDLLLPDIYVPPRDVGDDWLEATEDRRRPTRPPAGERDEDRPLPPLVIALARAAPSLLAAVVAVGGSAGSRFLPDSDLPVTLLLVVVVQLVGYVIARSNGLWPWSRAFLVNAAIVVALLPLLAIQASTTRAPYVSTDLSTDRPAIIATVAAVAGLVVLAVAVVGIGWEAPSDSALLFLPGGLLVPALLGTAYEASEDDVARLLAEVFIFTAVATFAATLAPPLLASLVGVGTLAAYFGLLLVADRGPTKEPTSGEIARILDGSLVAVTMALTVVVPLAAAGVRRVMREVHAAERASLYERLARE